MTDTEQPEQPSGVAQMRMASAAAHRLHWAADLMTLPIHRLVYPLLTSALLASLGCAAEEVHDADFAVTTPAQRIVAFGAAHGDFVDGALNVTHRLTYDSEGICPKLTTDGDKRILEGGCERGGIRYDGKATLVVGKGDSDLSASWDQFTVVEGGKRHRLNGTAHRRGDGETRRTFAALELEDGGVVAHLDVELACDGARQCTPTVGSTLTLDGVGTADVAGSWRGNHETNGGGTVELRGKNTLAVDLAQESAGRCYATSIDGVAIAPVCLGE